MNILVVDREEELPVAVAILESAPGNEVRTATAGQQALDMSEGYEVELLITEVILDPMNGFTLRNKMENRHRGVRTIFLSGYDLSPYREHTEGYEVVSKPATPQKLLPAIARATVGMVKKAAPVEAKPEPKPEPPPAAAAEPPAPARAAPVKVKVKVKVPDAEAISSEEEMVEPAKVPPPAPEPEPVAAAAPPAIPAPAAILEAAPVIQTTLPPAQAVAARPAEKSEAAVPALAPAQTATSGKGAPIILPPKPTVEEAATIAAKVSAAAAPKAAAPAPQPASAAPAQPAPPPAPRPSVKAAGDPMIGKTIGTYRIERRVGNGRWGPVYVAIQTSMNRPVAMELLASERAADSKARDAFVATARAKAAVQHPHILSVYEADEAAGFLFYTHEYVDGATVAQMAAKNQTLSDHVALQTIKYVAQALAHLHQHSIAHSILEASDIYVGKDGLPYVSNVALQGKEMPPVQEEICTLAEIIRSVLPEGDAVEAGLRSMLTRMGITNQMGFQSWPPLFQAIQAIEPKVVPADAFKLSAQDEAAIRAVEVSRRKQRNVLISSLAGLVVFMAVLAGAVWWEFLRPISHDFTGEMVKVSEGEFIYQDGQKIVLPTFYIDTYDVTLGEYGKFLQYLQDHDYPADYDSPLQPKGLSHVPKDWDIYFGRASSALAKYRTVKGVPITLDCPVFNVTYFDAYAYAKWKGHRLPTQEEWEKAARGPYGNLYPWGNVWDPTKLNAGSDYQAEPPPGYKPTVDGFNWWNPVDAILTDKSYYGAIGMAGNVSEWTDSWDPSKTYVYIRGGNYKSNSAQAMLTNQIKAYPQVFAETLGFRTVSDTPPPAK